MVDKKQIEQEERRMADLADRINKLIMEEAKGRPYLFVMSTLFEVDREGDKSKIAAQWNWRSNVASKEEGRPKDSVENAKKMVNLLIEALTDVANRPQTGIKAHYNIK